MRLKDKMIPFAPFLLFLFLFVSCVVEYPEEKESNYNMILTSPSTGLLPFPWDLYTIHDIYSPTGIRVKIPSSRMRDPVLNMYGNPVTWLDKLSGFGLNAPVILKFSEGIDPEIIAKLYTTKCTTSDSPVFLLTISGKNQGEMIPIEPEFDYDKNYLFLYPYKPLEPSTQYSLVITDKLISINGNKPEPDSYYFHVFSGETDFAGKRISRERKTTLILLKELFPDIKPVFILSFTTMDIFNIPLKGKETIEMKTPELYYPENFTSMIVDKKENFSEDTGLVIKGVIPLFNFQNKDGEIDFDFKRNEFTSIHIEEVPFLLLYSRKGTEPFPVMIYQHGLNNRKESVYSIADAFNGRGIAIIAIDAVYHGERTPYPGDELDLIKNFIGLWPVRGILKIKPYLLRDNFLQTAFNHFQIIEFLKEIQSIDIYNPKTGKMEKDSIPDIKVQTIGYQGQSMGAFIGTLTSALSPEIGAAILNVGGGRIMEVVRQNMFYRVGGKNLLTYFDMDHPSEGERFLALFQTLLDYIDPASYGYYLLHTDEGVRKKPLNLLMENVWKDMIVPNSATAYLARAIEIPLLQPVFFDIPGIQVLPLFEVSGNIQGKYTAALSEYYMIYTDTSPHPATHGALLASPEAKEEGSDFLQSYFHGLSSGKPPVIRSPYSQQIRVHQH